MKPDENEVSARITSELMPLVMNYRHDRTLLVKKLNKLVEPHGLSSSVTGTSDFLTIVLSRDGHPVFSTTSDFRG